MLHWGLICLSQVAAHLSASALPCCSRCACCGICRSLCRRSHSGPNLARISPSAHGLGLARRSPAPAAASLVAHSRGNSFSGSSRPSSRSSSYNNLARWVHLLPLGCACTWKPFPRLALPFLAFCCILTELGCAMLHPMVCRASANLAAMNGGVQPSLEQLRPDMFFGVDDDEEDDGSSGEG